MQQTNDLDIPKKDDFITEVASLKTRYKTTKEKLEWADDDWAADEINEELDQYAKEIKILKTKVREFEQKQA
jgi:uncharacterized coiled-coil DUF342 family protein